eukprot:5947257-Ditylum_brightwellii.AAC.1
MDNIIWYCSQKIGLHAIFDGKLTSGWANEQDDFLWDKKLWTEQTNGHQCTRQIIKMKTKVIKDRLKCTIKTMYHLKDQLLVVDMQYMFQPMVEIEEFLAMKSF